MTLFKPAPSHNPLQAPAVCLCVDCCRIVDTLRCKAVSKDGRRCGDYKHRGKTHSLIVATVFQIVDERLEEAAMDEKRTTEPHDRLTRICDAMTKAFAVHPEHLSEDRCVVFLSSRERSGLVMSGYDDDVAAIAEVLVHLQAIFRANGKDLQIIGIPDDISGLEP